MIKRYIIGIDDTDDIDTKGTGEIATKLKTIIDSDFLGTSEKAARHQLLIHPNIPYTSHNSPMIFTRVLMIYT